MADEERVKDKCAVAFASKWAKSFGWRVLLTLQSHKVGTKLPGLPIFVLVVHWQRFKVPSFGEPVPQSGRKKSNRHGTNSIVLPVVAMELMHAQATYS